jgi:type VI secretion system protein ImpJ
MGTDLPIASIVELMELSNKKSLKPIFWHQEQFLHPQHFQHTDLYHQTSYYPLMKVANPFFWGVIFIEIDESALINDVFEVESGEFIMPDGMYIDYPDNSVLSSRSFASAWTDRNAPFKVYLGLRKLDKRGHNVSIVPQLNDCQHVTTRFITPSQPGEIVDYYQDGPSTAISTLTYALKLFWESEVEDATDYELLPIAQIIHDGEVPRLSKVFIPPCVHIASSPILLKGLKEINNELAGRIKQLEEYKTPIRVSGMTIDLNSIPYRMTLQLLCQYVPLLHHYVTTPTIHPWLVFGILKQLIGGISSLSDQVDFLGRKSNDDQTFPSYDHNQLGTCFGSAYDLITWLLNEITLKSESIIRLEKVSPAFFKADIPKEFFDAQEMFLSLITEVPNEEYISSFLNIAKIGSAGQIRIFSERSLPGLIMKPLNIPPEGVPKRPNAYYFRINRSDSAWVAIQQEKNITLLWDDAPQDLKVEFIIIRR